MSDLVIRMASPGDIDQLEALEAEAWPECGRATAKQWESRIKIFPEGTIVATNQDGIVFGVVSSLLVDYDFEKDRLPSWEEITAGGFITNHDPKGKYLYGVDFSARPGLPGAADGLLLAGARLGVRKKVKAIMLGSRMPRYYRYADLISPQDYLYLSQNGIRSTERGGVKIKEDPEVFMYRECGMTPAVLLPGYYPDPESCDNGVLMVWNNTLADLPFPWLWSALAGIKAVRRRAGINI